MLNGWAAANHSGTCDVSGAQWQIPNTSPEGVQNVPGIQSLAVVVGALLFAAPGPAAEDAKEIVLRGIKPTLTGYRNRAFVETTKVGPEKKEMTVFGRKKDGDYALAFAKDGSLWGDARVRVAVDAKILTGEAYLAIDGDSGFTGNLDYDESTYTFLGKVRLLKHVFSSDEKDPLVFKLVKEKGFVHLKGTGSVVLPDGKTLSIAAPEANKGDFPRISIEGSTQFIVSIEDGKVTSISARDQEVPLSGLGVGGYASCPGVHLFRFEPEEGKRYEVKGILLVGIRQDSPRFYDVGFVALVAPDKIPDPLIKERSRLLALKTDSLFTRSDFRFSRTLVWFGRFEPLPDGTKRVVRW